MVTLLGQIQVPDDWRDSSDFQSITTSLDLEIRVHPCQVESFVLATAPIGTAVYLIGGPSMIFGRYAFSQTPNCGYQEKVSVKDLPAQYVTHDAQL